MMDNNWIPCTERTPTQEECVKYSALFLVTVDNYIELGIYNRIKDEWYSNSDMSLIDVVAWKSIPDPYCINA